MGNSETRYFKKNRRGNPLVAIVDPSGKTSVHNEFGFRIEPFQEFDDQTLAVSVLTGTGWTEFFPEKIG